MRVLLVHSQDRPFEIDRFGAAWERAGGEPGELVPITPSTASQVLGQVSVFSGVLTTGGPDVAPWRYGGEPDPQWGVEPEEERDRLDWELLERAEGEHLPVLAVCYGSQLLNVFYGGTLIPHLPAFGKEGHRVSHPKDFIAHQVLVEPASRWLRGFPPSFGVNSRHHQAVDRLGKGLKIAARAAHDGVVEAFEAEGERFVLGIQWHPENLLFEPHLELFRRFRQACVARARQ